MSDAEAPAAAALNEVLQQIVVMNEAAAAASGNGDKGVAQAALDELSELALREMPRLIQKQGQQIAERETDESG